VTIGVNAKVINNIYMLYDFNSPFHRQELKMKEFLRTDRVFDVMSYDILYAVD